MVLPGFDLSWVRELLVSLPIVAKGGGKGGKAGSPPKAPQLPPLPPPPPAVATPTSTTPESPEVKQARADQVEAERKMQGRRSLITNLGGAAGDLSDVPVGKGTLISLKTKTGG